MASEECVGVDDVKTCLTRGQSLGLLVAAESGFVSVICVLALFVFIARNLYRNSKRPAIGRRRLLQEPADVLVLSLFIADLLHAIGTSMNTKWAAEGVVQVGTFCTAQGIFIHLGTTTIATSTLAIALQTFAAIWFRRFVHDMRPAYACVALIWVFVVLFVAIGTGVHGGSNYYNPTPYWCWVGDNFFEERIAGQYFWLWLSLFVSVLVYVPIFLWSKGYISIDKTYWWKIRLSDEGNSRDKPEPLSVAILSYPAVYSVVILPLSIVRWITFSHGHDSVPSAATFAAISIWGLSGAANVVLIITTRPNLLLFDSNPLPDVTGNVEMGRLHNDEDTDCGHSVSTAGVDSVGSVEYNQQ